MPISAADVCRTALVISPCGLNSISLPNSKMPNGTSEMLTYLTMMSSDSMMSLRTFLYALASLLIWLA